jgi:Uncharacterised nucleotidyltransferase
MAIDVGGARANAVLQLAQDAATAEVVSALEARGIRAILLKGAAIAARLYDDPAQRPYSDGDLLVEPSRYREAVRVLEGLGYVDSLGDVREAGLYHARSFRRRTSAIDLHWRLPATTDGAMTWAALSANTQPQFIGGREIETLTDAGLAVVICCHVVHHGPAQQPRQDLEQALQRFDRQVWRRAAHIAGELGIRDFLAAGLREHPGGDRLAGELGLPADTTAEIQSLLAGPTPLSDGFIRLGKVTSVREFVAVLAGDLFPSPAFMRQAWSFTRRGRAALALGYLYRPLWLALNAPPAYWRWRRANRVATGRQRSRGPSRPAA